MFGCIITIGSLIGGVTALGGNLSVIWQPWEYLIIAGMALGIYIIANPWKVVIDTGVASVEAFTVAVPKQRHYLDLLGLLHALMREVRNKGRNEVEAHIDDPSSSEIFKSFPTVLANDPLSHFVCDYFRLIIMGSARPHEKPYHSLMIVAEGLPALGIVAAVLGVIKAMGAIDQSPKLLGGLIGAALVGTFAGIFLSYGAVAPLAHKVKTVREQKCRLYIIVKQTLLAFMNGALPQIAIEHGRKMIGPGERPSIDVVENETITGGTTKNAGVEPVAKAAGARA